MDIPPSLEIAIPLRWRVGDTASDEYSLRLTVGTLKPSDAGHWSSLMAHLWHPPRYSWPTTGKFAVKLFSLPVAPRNDVPLWIAHQLYRVREVDDEGFLDDEIPTSSL